MASALATIQNARSIPTNLKNKLNGIVTSNQRARAVAAAKAAKAPFIAGGAAFAGGFADSVLEEFGITGMEVAGVQVDPSEMAGLAAVGIGLYEGSSDLSMVGAGLSASLAKKLGKKSGDYLRDWWSKENAAASTSTPTT